MLQIGENLESYNLYRWGPDGSQANVAVSDYATDITLLSFIDFNDADCMEWLECLINLANLGIANLSIIAVFFTKVGGAVDPTDLQDKIDTKYGVGTYNTTNIPITVFTDNIWTSSLAFQYANQGFNVDTNFRDILDGSNDLISGIDSMFFLFYFDYLTDKWHTNSTTFKLTGDTNSGSATITNISDTGYCQAGDPIQGPGIPASTTIQSVDSTTQITLSSNATATAAGVEFTVGNDDPVSFHHLSPSGLTFDSTDFDNTEAFATERINNISAANPTILYTGPAKNSVITDNIGSVTANFGDYDPIKVVFSKPMNNAPYDIPNVATNYTRSNLIAGAGYSITITDPDGDSNAKNKIENVVFFRINSLANLSGGSDGTATVTLNNATDTTPAANPLTDNNIPFIVNMLAPEITSWTPATLINDGGQIVVTFSEDVDQSQAEDVTNYTVSYSGSTGNVSIGSILYNSTLHQATLTMSITGTDGTGFTISGETGITDGTYNLNTSATNNQSPSYGTPDTTSALTHDIVLVLDYSSSMRSTVPIRELAPGFTADDYEAGVPGSYITNYSYTRTEILESSVQAFVVILTEFDAKPTVNTVVRLIKYRTNVDDEVVVTAGNIGDELENDPSGLTAMGGGLYRAMKSLELSTADNRQIVLFTDGIQNQNPMVYKADPPYDSVDESDELYLRNMTSAEVAGYPWRAGSFGNSNVAPEIETDPDYPVLIDSTYPIFTIGMGTSDTFQAMLTDLSIQSDNNLLAVNPTLGNIYYTFSSDTMWPESNNAFLDHLRKIYDGYSPQVVFSGTGFYIENSENPHEFNVNKSSIKIVVHINWIGDSPLKAVLEKDGSIITDNVTCAIYNTFSITSISFPNNQFETGDAVDGIWRVKAIKADTSDYTNPITYSINVLSDEEVVHVGIEPPEDAEEVPVDIPAGEDIPLDVSSDEDGGPSDSIYSVGVTVIHPAIPLWMIVLKYRGWILKQSDKEDEEDRSFITDKWYDTLCKNKEILAEISKKKITKISLKPVMRKISYLRKRVYKRRGIKKLKDFQKVYSGNFPRAVIPGLYKIVFNIRGAANKGGVYERTLNRTIHVVVKPDKKYTKICGWHDSREQFFKVYIKPRDKFGNLLTPGSAGNLTCTIDSRKHIPINDIIDNFDGSYTIKISGTKGDELKKRNLKIESKGETLFNGLISEVKKCCPIFRIFRKLFWKTVPIRVTQKDEISEQEQKGQ